MDTSETDEEMPGSGNGKRVPLRMGCQEVKEVSGA